MALLLMGLPIIKTGNGIAAMSIKQEQNCLVTHVTIWGQVTEFSYFSSHRLDLLDSHHARSSVNSLVP